MQGELSVAITGTDTLSPALQRVNQQLERSKVALSASGAVASDYTKKLQALQVQYATGEIDAIKYDRALRRLDRSFQQTTSDIQAYATRTAAATGTTNQFVAATDHATRGATRLVFGVQSLSSALQGGRVSAQGMVSALTALGVGSGAFIVVTAGLSVIANLLLQMGDNADNTSTRVRSLVDDLRALGPAGARGRILDLSLQLYQRQEDPSGTLFLGLDGLTRKQREINALVQQIRELNTALEIMNNDPGRQANGRRQPGQPNRDLMRTMALRGINTGPRERFGEGDTGSALEGRDKTWSAAFTTATPLAEKFLDTLDRVPDKFGKITAALRMFSEATVAGFGAAIDAAASGQHVFQAFIRGEIAAIGSKSKIRALEEAAEAFSSGARGDFRGAALHAAAAVKFGVIAGGAGAIAGAVGGGNPAASRATASTGTVGGGGVTIINQFVTPDGRETARTVAQVNARQERLGAPVLGQSVLPGLFVGGPIVRAA